MEHIVVQFVQYHLFEFKSDEEHDGYIPTGYVQRFCKKKRTRLDRLIQYTVCI